MSHNEDVEAPQMPLFPLTLYFCGVDGMAYAFSARTALGEGAATAVENMPLADRVLLRSVCEQVLMIEDVVRDREAAQ